jgi:hypothetical protein
MNRLLISVIFASLFMTLIVCPVLVGAENKASLNSGSEMFLAISKKKGDDIKAVESLLASGINVNVKDSGGFTPLHQAVMWQKPYIVKLLISKGADVNATNAKASTPLHWAVTLADVAVLEMLVSNGANVNAKDFRGFTPLHQAVNLGKSDIVKLLISKGADVNATNSDARTPLHLAITRADTSTLQMLASKGANVNAKDKDGKTPLALDACLSEDKYQILKSNGALGEREGTCRSSASVASMAYTKADVADGQLRTEGRVFGEIAIIDEATSGVLRIKSGMTKDDVEKAASESKVRIFKLSDDKWRIGKKTIIFENNKFTWVSDY